VVLLASAATFPLALYTLARLLAGNYFGMRTRIRVAAAAMIVAILIAGLVVGEAHPRYLECEDFERIRRGSDRHGFSADVLAHKIVDLIPLRLDDRSASTQVVWLPLSLVRPVEREQRAAICAASESPDGRGIAKTTVRTKRARARREEVGITRVTGVRGR